MTLDSRRTSFFAVTDDPSLGVDRIEIPHFQRDYAQGRESQVVQRIRSDFLDVLHGALVGDLGSDVGLDFVYGGVEDGTLRPLDGQQRMTTLFLLHWYVASRSGNLDSGHGWKRFAYATRQGARMFCERLVEHSLPQNERSPSAWIQDQPWYLFVWRHDPTIQSMLVMVDAIHQRFRDLDPKHAWARLTDLEDPAIWFLLLPLSELGSSDEHMRAEDLYIKMNSRGKPLTEFENFKAHFEKTIEWSPWADEFELKVDTTWSDFLWHLRGDDFLIDDEFLRYMEFITEICEWRDGRDDGAGHPLGTRTEAVFGGENPNHAAHLEFLFQAFDVWLPYEASTQAFFEGMFTSEPDDDPVKVRLFFRSSDSPTARLDLFEGCCRSYGERSGSTRVFSLGQTVLLYATILHLIEDTSDFAQRLRVLRNLVEASSDEMRAERMPRIIEDVDAVIRSGAIDEVAGLSQAQVADEKAKSAFLESRPMLREAISRLEDEEVLRGSLGAFDLDEATFESRASIFRRLMSQPDLWSDFLAALLAVGEYQRRPPNARHFLLGTDSKRHDNAWRNLLTGVMPDGLRTTRTVLAEFLDRVVASPTGLEETLRDIASEYCSVCEREERFDWRYYMVKYPGMRENGSSTYFSERPEGAETVTMGYSLAMLRAGGKSLNGYHRDPYLLSIVHELADPAVVEDPWFIGYETQARRLLLAKSGASLRCVQAGFELAPPPMEKHLAAFDRIATDMAVEGDNLIRLPQVEVEGYMVDIVDRIHVGAEIVGRLTAAGL